MRNNNGKKFVLDELDNIPEIKGVKASGNIEIAPGGCVFILLKNKKIIIQFKSV